MSFITAIGVAVPENKLEQSAISDFMERLAEDDEQIRKIRTVFRASAIKTRHSVLNDYNKSADFNFFPNNKSLNPFPGTAMRMGAYRKHAIDLSLKAIDNALQSHPFVLKEVSHLITVSCTGMYAPGLDVDIIQKLGLNRSISRTCINFMGCFAAISAIKLANSFCGANPQAKVLIVCTELCSLHFQKEFTDDNILANALFADGSAALVVESNKSGYSLMIDGFYSDIVPHGAEHMAWTIGDFGFEMKLSAYVPEVLGNSIEDLIGNLKRGARINGTDHVRYAIHPGGKKILDVVSSKLSISKSELQHAYDVLHDFGNMSSPTLIFVLKRMMDDGTKKTPNRIVGMAFGPGITLESMMLKLE